MTIAADMMRSYPRDITIDRSLLADAVSALMECAEACTACADACLSETDLEVLRRCIRMNLDCADVCSVTERVLARHTGYDATVTVPLLTACIQACRSCGSECGRHAQVHEHCAICSEACRRCEEACVWLLTAIHQGMPDPA